MRSVAAVIALVACWEETPPLGDDPVVGARNLARWNRGEVLMNEVTPLAGGPENDKEKG